MPGYREIHMVAGLAPVAIVEEIRLGWGCCLSPGCAAADTRFPPFQAFSPYCGSVNNPQLSPDVAAINWSPDSDVNGTLLHLLCLGRLIGSAAHAASVDVKYLGCVLQVFESLIPNIKFRERHRVCLQLK